MGEEKKEKMLTRRDFLSGLKKWSKVVLAGAAFSAGIGSKASEAGWINRRGGWGNGGGSWINRHGGGGWINRHRGGGWINRR